METRGNSSNLKREGTLRVKFAESRARSAVRRPLRQRNPSQKD